MLIILYCQENEVISAMKGVIETDAWCPEPPAGGWRR